MSAKVDRPDLPSFRLVAAALLLLMTVGLSDRSFASGHDAGARAAEAASRTSCDAGHSDSGCWHPDHSDESDIPVVDVPAGLGRARRLASSCPDGGTAVSPRPPVRPPSP
jgi:hypothetical protein